MNSIAQTFPVVDRQGRTDEMLLVLIADWLVQHPRYTASLEAYLNRVAREESAEAQS